MRRLRIRHFLFALAVSALSVPSQVVRPVEADPTSSLPTTQPMPGVDESAQRISGWLSDLASDEPDVRSEAFTHLIALNASEVPLLRQAVMAAGALQPSQMAALRQIVTQAFLSGQIYEGNNSEGFLGVRMDECVRIRDTTASDGTQAIAGIEIVERMPGFAGARALRDGDIIFGIAERPELRLVNATEFSTVVRGMGGGCVVHFLLLRQGRVKTVTAVLDPRPVDADMVQVLLDLIESRRLKADAYWKTRFAPLLARRH